MNNPTHLFECPSYEDETMKDENVASIKNKSNRGAVLGGLCIDNDRRVNNLFG